MNSNAAQLHRLTFPQSQPQAASLGQLVADLEDQRNRRRSPSTEAPQASSGDGTIAALVVIPVPFAFSEEWLGELAGMLGELTRTISQHAVPKAEEDSAPVERGLAVGRLHIDFDHMQVTVSQRPVEFTPQEFLLLKAFMQNPGKVLSRPQLCRMAWKHSDWSTGRTVDVHVRRIRVKLGAEAARLVTVRGFGYRLDASDAQTGGVTPIS